MRTDALFLLVIVAILVITNIAVANIRNEYENAADENQDDLSDDLPGAIDSSGVNSVTTFQIIAGIFAWSFGLLPAWLDTFFIVLRLFGYYLIGKLIRGVGT